MNSIQSANLNTVNNNNNNNSSMDVLTSNNNKNIKIGTYELLGTIGHGNFSVCKLALNKLTNAKVAIKCIEKKSIDESHLKRIYKEIDIMKSLDHKHIIKLYQVMESKSMLYLVCEYAINGEIFDYILKNGAMSERLACEKFSQILSAVEYCHYKSVVHRDLKSENLLLDHNMNIKLADFGFANHFDLINPLNTFCGSPPYAAPEIFCGKKYFGPEIDIWSMGVILYVLVTASLPFDSDNLQLLKQRVLSCNYNVPFFLSLDCQNLIGGMLELNPSKRFKLKQIKSHRWIKLNSYYVLSSRKSDKSNKNDENPIFENKLFNKIQSKSLGSLNKDSLFQVNNHKNISNNIKNFNRLSILSLPLYSSFNSIFDQEITDNLADQYININKTGSYYQIKENSEKTKKLLSNSVYSDKSRNLVASELKSNKYSNIFKNFEIFSNLVSNYSSSLDESGVESDLSSQTSSSFSSDLLSSVASCYSIQYDSPSFNSNSSVSQRIVRYRFDHGSTSSTSSTSSSNNNKKNSLPASLAQSRKNKFKTQNNKSKNVNDLTQIKHELNSLIRKNQTSSNKTSCNPSNNHQSSILANLLSKNNKNINEEEETKKIDAQDFNTKQNGGRLIFSRLSGKIKKNINQIDDSQLNQSHSQSTGQNHHQNKLARFFGFKKPLKEKSCSLNSLTNSVQNLKLEKIVYKKDEVDDKIEQNIMNNNDKQHEAKSCCNNNNNNNNNNNIQKINSYFDHFKLNSSYSRFKFYRKYSLKN